MGSAGERTAPDRAERSAPHRWVGAAMVDLGTAHAGRAEHAARTGRHVLRAATRVAVLEVYCLYCRVGFDSHAATKPCPGAPAARRVA